MRDLWVRERLQTNQLLVLAARVGHRSFNHDTRGLSSRLNYVCANSCVVFDWLGFLNLQGDWLLINKFFINNDGLSPLVSARTRFLYAYEGGGRGFASLLLLLCV